MNSILRIVPWLFVIVMVGLAVLAFRFDFVGTPHGWLLVFGEFVLGYSARTVHRANQNS